MVKAMLRVRWASTWFSRKLPAMATPIKYAGSTASLLASVARPPRRSRSRKTYLISGSLTRFPTRAKYQEVEEVSTQDSHADLQQGDRHADTDRDERGEESKANPQDRSQVHIRRHGAILRLSDAQPGWGTMKNPYPASAGSLVGAISPQRAVMAGSIARVTCSIACDARCVFGGGVMCMERMDCYVLDFQEIDQ